MNRTVIAALAGLAAAVTASSAGAFWPRSQWLACSEAATAADYRRWRCWELEQYGGAIAPGQDGAGIGGPAETPRRSLRRGRVVSRLG